jgi:branched-chain amino acid transport system ATP-binding protein
VSPKSGTIRLNGVDISKLTAHRIRRLGISYLPEGRGIFPGLSVWDNLRMATRWRPGSRNAKTEAIERTIEPFPILGRRRNQKAGSLSGGEQQMLSIAAGLVVSPRLLILDELSLGLAPLVIDQLLEALAKARDEGTTILLIEQYIHRALAFCEECAILRRGRIDWHGAALDAKEELLKHYLGDNLEEELLSNLSWLNWPARSLSSQVPHEARADRTPFGWRWRARRSSPPMVYATSKASSTRWQTPTTSRRRLDR